MNGAWYFNPVLAELGPVKIHWYGIMYGLAFLLGYFYFHRSKHGKSLPLTGDQKDLFLAYVIGGVLIGGRLGYILFYNLNYYLENPLQIFAVWEGGMSFHGGLLAVAAGILWFSKKYRVKLFSLTDVVCAIAPLGIMFGRLGNFINGELYGRIASGPGSWCLYFPADPANCRYPSQLFEAFFEGLLLFLILFLLRKRSTASGALSSAFLVLYGGFRFVIEFFREPDVQIGFLPGGFTEGQLLCALMVICGILLAFSLRKTSGKAVKQ